MYGALIYMIAGAQYQIIVATCLSNLVDLTGITPPKGLQFVNSLSLLQKYVHLFGTYYFISVCKHCIGKNYVKRHLYKQWILSHVRTYVYSPNPLSYNTIYVSDSLFL